MGQTPPETDAEKPFLTVKLCGFGRSGTVSDWILARIPRLPGIAD